MQVSTLNTDASATWPAELPATVEDARDALRAVLAAILEQERHPRCVAAHGRVPPAEVWRCDDPIPSADKSLFRALTRDAIGRALRYALRRVGHVLFDLGGTALMKKTLYEVVDTYDSPVYEALADICDKRWDGIGAGNDAWCA
jgi:hypothetical protein